MPLDCCERARGSVLGRGPSGPTPSSKGRLMERRGVMEVMFDRVAGLDVGKDSVTVWVRTPGRAVAGAA